MVNGFCTGSPVLAAKVSAEGAEIRTVSRADVPTVETIDDIEFVRQHCFQVFTVGVANLYFARFGRWFTTEFYDFVGEVMCVQLLVGDFGEKKLSKLRSVRTGGFGCIYGKLYNRTKFGGQILV